MHACMHTFELEAIVVDVVLVALVRMVGYLSLCPPQQCEREDTPLKHVANVGVADIQLVVTSSESDSSTEKRKNKRRR